MNTEYNKPMEWSDISDLINSASDYLHFLRTYGFVNNASINEIVNRLHNAIDHFDIKMIGSVLGRFNVNQSTIIEDVECKLHIVDDLTKEIGNNMPIIMKEIDPKVSNVFQFLSELSSELTLEKVFLEVRCKSDPTIGDERANKKLQLFIDGQYGEMSFSIFMSRYVLNDIPTHVLGDSDYYVINPTAYYAKKRRLEYLIANCNDDVIKEQLYCYLERCKKEIANYDDAPTPELLKVVNSSKTQIANYDDEPTPEPQLSPTSGNADDVTPPDTSTIMELMLLDDEEQKQRLLATLHKLVDGKKGKHVALVFLICEKCGLMNKPTHNILTSIFGDIGAKSGYNNYYSKGLSYYKQEQIKGVETHILPFINGH